MPLSDSEVQKYVKGKFTLIEEATTIENLISIEKKSTLKGKTVDYEKYPKINFTINSLEIRELRDKGILDENYGMVTGAIDKIQDPLTKLFYSVLWKNGDLIKLKHIVKGIVDASSDSQLPDDAIVFYQFGKYLTGKVGEPIIDQHILRAFALYKTTDVKEVKRWRQFELVKKDHHTLIKDYIVWLHSVAISDELKSIEDYTYYIDRVLFALGKYAKL